MGKRKLAATSSRKPTPHPKDKEGTMKQFKTVVGKRKRAVPKPPAAAVRKSKTAPILPKEESDSKQ